MFLPHLTHWNRRFARGCTNADEVDDVDDNIDGVLAEVKDDFVDGIFVMTVVIIEFKSDSLTLCMFLKCLTRLCRF